MPFINIKGKKIFYEELGQQQSGNPIVFIHGGGGNHNIWMEQVERLSKDRHVVALSLPGHDQSEGPACSSIRDYADLVSEFISTYFKEQKVVIAGHSMGGAIVQQIAVDGFDQISGAVMVSTGANLKIPPEFLDQVRKGEISEESFLAAFSPKTSATVHQKVGSWLSLTPMESTIQDFETINQHDLSDSISKINVPTLIVVGKDDVLTPVTYSEALHKGIPDSMLTIIPDAGHYVVSEQPKALQDCIQQFMNKIDE
ncbi:alpha/beta fold hydrolase [Aquibacillus albus]|uniref:Pimeloyl-ACP methyl ester carboxylesterase n=1 Tax=Aquibacillus albus TaxID=1168171 RepID=A0ABS2MZL1_9BACI|nr:alpha/beta hydrolase [Aquibacillus albus]MBM7571341.1 pimeloyl-ACP methyl ester carboxylesterase [Aquibacillus albus]